jgi:hypothetical protein
MYHRTLGSNMTDISEAKMTGTDYFGWYLVNETTPMLIDDPQSKVAGTGQASGEQSRVHWHEKLFKPRLGRCRTQRHFLLSVACGLRGT